MKPSSSRPPSRAGRARRQRRKPHEFGDNLVLDNVSVTVPRGTFGVLLGLERRRQVDALFSLVTRLYDNVTGEIHILGHDVRRKPGAALQRLGVVFQSKTLDPDLTLTQNLLYHAALHGIGRREAKVRAREALALVGLADRGNDKVRNLSGGQARRVEIARSMLHRPGLLLLDEADRRPRHRLARKRHFHRARAREIRRPRRPLGHASDRRDFRYRSSSSSCTRDACCSPARCPASWPQRVLPTRAMPSAP